MKLVADLHLHSKFSRATSKQNNLETFANWVPKKGIDVLGTADFTHPFWFKELNSKLKEVAGSGLYQLKDLDSPLRFMLTTEISLIWSQAGKVRKTHLVILAPSLATVAKIGAIFSKIGNINADGRPIFGLSAREALARLLEIDSRIEVIPAHAWTPWFSVFGSNSGFDSLEEAFGDLTPHIHAIETGLSSDPPMNWRLGALDNVALVSFGDAHSLHNLMREATVFDVAQPTYDNIVDAIKNSSPIARRDQSQLSTNHIAYTIEFFPEEGKYHVDGHLACNVKFENPSQTPKDKICPICHKELTIGVLSRVEQLATRPMGEKPLKVIPYKQLVQLDQIIAEAWGVGEKSKKVLAEYDRLTSGEQTEFSLLLETPLDELKKLGDARIVEGIERVRNGNIFIDPGYDGEFGKVKVFTDKDNNNQQEKLF